MKTIFWYLLRRHTEMFLMCFAVLATACLVVDFFERLAVFLRNDAELLAILAHLFFRIPHSSFRLIPLAMLMATLLTLAVLRRDHEITAMRSFGISPYQIAAPFVAFGLILTLVLFSFTALIIPTARAKTGYFESVITQKNLQPPWRGPLWLRIKGDTLLHIGRVESEGALLRTIQLYRLDPEFQVTEMIRAEAARYTRRGWMLDRVRQRKLLANGNATLRKYASLPVELSLSPEEIVTWLLPAPPNLTLSELGAFIDRSRRDGHGVAGLLTDYWERITFPLTGFIIGIMGVALGLMEAGRRGAGMASSFWQALGIMALCWVTHSAGLLLGRSGTLTPVVAASSGTLLLFAISMGLFLKAKQQ